MVQEDVDQHMADLTDAELLQSIETVKADLTEAMQQANSERHCECFAAAVLYAHEAQRRGLLTLTVH